MRATRLQPAYLALTNPPDGSAPLFIQGITRFPRPIVATCIRLLTGHAFTGEYTARFRPGSFDPHRCHAVNPFEPCNMSSRYARYTLKHGDNISYQSQTPYQSQPSSTRRKEARRWEISWQRRRRASGQGGEKLHRRRTRITDSTKGRMAPPNYTQIMPVHDT